MRTHELIKEDGFWAGKTPCWVMRDCIFEARRLCRAYQDQSLPCWEQETLCKKLLHINTCFACQVFKEYGGAPEETDNEADGCAIWKNARPGKNPSMPATSKS